MFFLTPPLATHYVAILTAVKEEDIALMRCFKQIKVLVLLKRKLFHIFLQPKLNPCMKAVPVLVSASIPVVNFPLPVLSLLSSPGAFLAAEYGYRAFTALRITGYLAPRWASANSRPPDLQSSNPSDSAHPLCPLCPSSYFPKY